MFHQAHKVHHGPSGTCFPAKSPPEGLHISIKATGKLLDTVPGRDVIGQQIGSERNGSIQQSPGSFGSLAKAPYPKGLSTDPPCLVPHQTWFESTSDL